MSARRTAFHLAGASLAAALLFTVGLYTARHQSQLELAQRDERIASLRAEMDKVARTLQQDQEQRRTRTAATSGTVDTTDVAPRGAAAGRAMVEEIKRELQSEMGLVP